jgi:hypothetical protein
MRPPVGARARSSLWTRSNWLGTRRWPGEIGRADDLPTLRSGHQHHRWGMRELRRRQAATNQSGLDAGELDRGHSSGAGCSDNRGCVRLRSASATRCLRRGRGGGGGHRVGSRSGAQLATASGEWSAGFRFGRQAAAPFAPSQAVPAPPSCFVAAEQPQIRIPPTPEPATGVHAGRSGLQAARTGADTPGVSSALVPADPRRIPDAAASVRPACATTSARNSTADGPCGSDRSRLCTHARSSTRSSGCRRSGCC